MSRHFVKTNAVEMLHMFILNLFIYTYLTYKCCFYNCIYYVFMEKRSNWGFEKHMVNDLVKS